MKNKISPLSLLNPTKLRVLLSLGVKGYLADRGWFDANKTRTAIDRYGNPLPWVTYAFIDFIADRLDKTQDIFEFGSGNSTRFYAERTKSVVSVEHDRDWLETSSTLGLPNVEMIYCDVLPGGDYCKSAQRADKRFHIIIVDGRDRVNCCKEALEALTEDGVVVLDDSERTKYEPALHFFEENGFRHLPFTGMAPGVIISKRTSIFYRSNNCLGI